MAEPQPSDVREQVDNDEEHPTKLASAEDRKAAAALSSLDRPGDDDDKPPKGSEADQKALGEAMSKLEVTEKGTGPDGKIKAASETAKKKIKVDPVDVALLVEELELNKIKVTELLKAHDGNVVEAIRAWIAPVS